MKFFIHFYDKLYIITYLNYLVYPGGVQHFYAVSHILFSKILTAAFVVKICM